MAVDLANNNNINQMMNDIRILKMRISTGTAGGDKHYRHVQGVSATLWVVNHGLGKRPAITVTDSAGTVILGQIDHLDDNTAELRFNSPFSGFAECN